MSYNLSIGIVGLPNVGKSTLFKHLTSQEVHVANYPFATIDPNVGVVPVPDVRLQTLAKLSNSKKTIPAVVEFYDIAGLVKGANKGEGLGNQFLTHIRDCKAVVNVVRVFENPEIIHVEGKEDPVRDIEIIRTELALKDLDTVEKRIASLEKDLRANVKGAKESKELLEKIREKLQKSEYVPEFAEEAIVKELQLLTSKPQLYLLNGAAGDVSDALKEFLKNESWLQADLSAATALDELIAKAYDVLGLMSFFTTGEDETRAWTIKKGSKAPQAAGTIHTDFEKKFIRAEVIGTDKLAEAGGWNEGKKKGWVRLEGKDYIVQDGDVMVIRHG